VEQPNPSVHAVLLEAKYTGQALEILNAQEFVHPRYIVTKVDAQSAIPLRENITDDMLNRCLSSIGIHFGLTTLDEPRLKQAKPVDALSLIVSDWCKINDIQVEVSEDALANLPRKWEKLGNLILFPEGALSTHSWNLILKHHASNLLLLELAHALQADSIGLQHTIKDDQFRTSQVSMLLGTSHVNFVDNGVIYTFDAGKVMFSSGNITERQRIANIKMNGEIVIDAYAGIGYFTLPMLVHCGVAHVHACEINPHSVDGLRKGLRENQVEHKATLYQGDNQLAMAQLIGIADRVHLGLLPTSEPSWPAAIRCLKAEGGWIHVHINLEEHRVDDFAEELCHVFNQLAHGLGVRFQTRCEHIERVKWYAPHIRHVVYDLELRP